MLIIKLLTTVLILFGRDSIAGGMRPTELLGREVQLPQGYFEKYAAGKETRIISGCSPSQYKEANDKYTGMSFGHSVFIVYGVCIDKRDESKDHNGNVIPLINRSYRVCTEREMEENPHRGVMFSSDGGVNNIPVTGFELDEGLYAGAKPGDAITTEWKKHHLKEYTEKGFFNVGNMPEAHATKAWVEGKKYDAMAVEFETLKDQLEKDIAEGKMPSNKTSLVDSYQKKVKK